MAARCNKRTRADAAILDRLECDSRAAQTSLERGQTQLTSDNKLSSSDGNLAGPSCAADPQTPDNCCDKSQSEGEAGDSDQAAIDIERARIAVGTESVPRTDFDNLQAVVRQIADQMKWFTNKVSEDMALEGPDAVVDAPLDEQEDAELGPVLTVGVAGEARHRPVTRHRSGLNSERFTGLLCGQRESGSGY